MKTTVIKNKDQKQEWHLVDAKNIPLGRAASKVASLLIGKHKIDYSPRLISGDKVVVINAKKVKLTGNKKIDKKYYRHSGYADGFKERNAEYYLEKNPTFLIKNAVKGMLPSNKLRKKRLSNLYVYADEEHPHKAQLK